MTCLRVWPVRLAVHSCTALLLCAVTGCPDDPPPTGLPGTEGRARFVVSPTQPPVVDLEAWRALQRDNPTEAAAFVAAKRDELAAAQAGLDQVVTTYGGRVVSRWWMSGQVTIEIPGNAVANVRAAAGVASVEPDRLLE